MPADLPFEYGKNQIKKVSALLNELEQKKQKLDELHIQAQEKTELMEKAQDYAKKILPAMEDLRSSGDLLEELLGQEYKPYPSYEDLLFSVQ